MAKASALTDGNDIIAGRAGAEGSASTRENGPLARSAVVARSASTREYGHAARSAAGGVHEEARERSYPSPRGARKARLVALEHVFLILNIPTAPPCSPGAPTTTPSSHPPTAPQCASCAQPSSGAGGGHRGAHVRGVVCGSVVVRFAYARKQSRVRRAEKEKAKDRHTASPKQQNGGLHKTSFALK